MKKEERISTQEEQHLPSLIPEFTQEQKEEAASLRTAKKRMQYFAEIVNDFANSLGSPAERSFTDQDENTFFSVEGVKLAYSVLFEVPFENDALVLLEQLELQKKRSGNGMVSLAILQMVLEHGESFLNDDPDDKH